MLRLRTPSINYVASTGRTGDLNSTLGACTSTGVGTLPIKGTSSQTLGACTLSSAGTIPVATITGELNQVLGACTLSSVSTLLTHGTVNKELGTLTAQNEAKLKIRADVNLTLGDLAGTLTGAVLNRGQLDKILGACTLEGVIEYVPPNPSNADLNIVLDSLTRTLQAQLKLFGTLNKPLGACTIVSDLELPVLGILNKSLGSCTLSATCQIVGGRTAELDQTLGTLTLYANNIPGVPSSLLLLGAGT